MDPTANLLRDFDARVDDLRDVCIERFEAGGVAAGAEVIALAALAMAIARNLADWRALTRTLELAAPLDLRRAGALVLESVFDEILAPDAWRVLAGALALAQAGE
jgi:hypothetical protein